MTLRLASYNVHKCLGLDRRRSASRILDVIAELAADIVVLQEVDHRISPRRAALPWGLIHARTDYRALPFHLNEVSLGWHGQTILVRPGIEATRIQRIALPALEPRGAVLAEFATALGPLRVIGVHLGLVRRFREMQLAAIRAALSRHPEIPTAIMGDFNEWSPRNGVGPLKGAFRLHSPGPSYPALRPIARLDRIALGPGLHLARAGVANGRLSRVASDHLPIWADVRPEPAPAPAG